MNEFLKPAILALVTWIFISLVITFTLSLLLTAFLSTDYEPTFFGLLSHFLTIFRNWEPGFYLFLLLPIFSPLVLGVIATNSKKFTKVLTVGLPILALIPIALIYLIFISGDCGGEATILCAGIAILLSAFEVLIFITTLSVLPVAWSVHRFGIQNYKKLMRGSLLTGLIVFILFSILITVSASPLLATIGLETKQTKDKILEVKTHFTPLEPKYLPANVKEKRREKPTSNGLIWEYTCNNQPNALTITQVSLDKWEESAGWNLANKTLNEWEEYYNGLSKLEEQEKTAYQKNYDYELEKTTINQRKGLFVFEYYKVYIRTDLLIWGTDEVLIEIKNPFTKECEISKEEFIKIAESMR